MDNIGQLTKANDMIIGMDAQHTAKHATILPHISSLYCYQASATSGPLGIYVHEALGHIAMLIGISYHGRGSYNPILDLHPTYLYGFKYLGHNYPLLFYFLLSSTRHPYSD